MSDERSVRPLSLQDRFRGLMVGIAVGDAVGRPVEGHRQVSEAYLDEIRSRPRSMVYSDDTAMSIALAEALLGSGRFNGASMAKHFAGTYFSEPHRGYGRGIVDVFHRVQRGTFWDTAASIQFEGRGSYGNGGAMRVAPVALWAYPDLDRTIHLARLTASVTHTHPIGVEGAVIQAVACHHALRETFDPQGLLDQLDRLIETPEFRAKFEKLPRALERDYGDYARLHLGNWVRADASVLTALYCFLLGDGFEDTVIRAIRLGGDTDTIGAMAGALAGARYGLLSVPDTWRRVEGHELLVELADSMREAEKRRRSIAFWGQPGWQGWPAMPEWPGSAAAHAPAPATDEAGRAESSTRSVSGTRTHDVGIELGVSDKLLECVPNSDVGERLSIIEGEFVARHPTEAKRLKETYGPSWFNEDPPEKGHSISAYLLLRLRDLVNDGLVVIDWIPLSSGGRFPLYRRVGGGGGAGQIDD